MDGMTADAARRGDAVRDGQADVPRGTSGRPGGHPQHAVPLLERVRRDPPHWAGDEIQAWDEDAFDRLERLAVSRCWTEMGSVNVFRVVGTRRRALQGRTWLWLLEHGERMARNLELHAENPGYYLGEAHKAPTMSFISLDGQSWHVDSDGNHRTCIARFVFALEGERSMLHGVALSDWRIDWVLAEAMARLEEIVAERRLPWRLVPLRRTLGREDGPGWMLERYAPRLEVRRPEGIVQADARGAWALVREAGHRRWRRWWPFGGCAG